VTGSCEHSNGSSGTYKSGEFFSPAEQLSASQNDSAPMS
jgi:hypothetical protein